MHRLGAIKRFPFQPGAATFLAAVQHDARQSHRFGFLGLPYDAATTYRPGARLAPAAIRQASQMLTDGEHPHFGTEPAASLADWGDAAIPHVGQAAALDCVEQAVTAMLNSDAHPLCAGGDHSVTLGVLRALRRKSGAPLALVHFDAHCDTWADHFGDRTGHGTWVRDAIEERLIDPTATVQIGIRSPVSADIKRWLPDLGGTVLTAQTCVDGADAAIFQHIDTRVGSHRAVYLSFDIDALDPSVAPGTGTPEIGGLSPRFVLALLHRMAAFGWVGMDVVEVSPPYDQSEITALAAATLLWTYVAMQPAG